MTTGKKPPKYHLIANALRTAIREGEYCDGDQLPGVRELAAEYDVAKMTVSQALDALKSEGLIESRGRAGVFVRSFAPILRRGIQRLAKERWGSGASIWSTDETRELVVDQLRVEEATAPEHITAILELDAGAAVCVRSRRFVIEGRPVMLSRASLPQALVAGSAITQPDTGPGGTYARLAELGSIPVHFREQLRFRTATADEAARLELPIGSPVVQIVRTAWAEGRRPVEVNEMVLDAGVYIFDYEFDA